MDWESKLNNLCFMINSIKKISLSVLESDTEEN